MATTAIVRTEPPSSNPFLSILTGPRAWSLDSPVTYYLEPGDFDGDGIDDWSQDRAGDIRLAFESWANVSGLEFQEVFTPEEANIIERINDAGGNLGQHWAPSQDQIWGDFNQGFLSGGMAQPGGYSFMTFVHELGHGIGLGHTHDGNRWPGVTDPYDSGDFGLNQTMYSVMSYIDGWDQVEETSGDWGWQSGPMAFDIAAAQFLYGPDMAFHAGEDRYALPAANGDGTFFSCIWDAGGASDVISAEGAGAAATIELRAATLREEPGGGGFVSRIEGILGGFTIAHGVTIERAIGGAFDDTLIGNAAANVLDGGSGGADRLTGGAGNDTYVVGHAGVTVIEAAGGGTDTVEAVIDTKLADNVEKLILTGTGGRIGLGNNLANTLTGNAGNDVLDGNSGADILIGAAGNDTYMVDNAGDRVIEQAGAGIDTVEAAISYTLAANVDRLLLTGTSGGNGTGNALANTLTGNAGNNVLDGKAGADILIGGAGYDTYVVDNAGDLVIEQAGQGADTVRAATGYTLAGNVENLMLTGASNITGTGNGLTNVIVGSTGANTLAGLGARDTLTGGAGGDTFAFRALGDSTVSATGRDTITDFSRMDRDRIDLRLIDANSALAGDQPFSFVGSAAFGHKAGELRYEASGSNTLVSGDVDGDGAADFAILLTGPLTLARGDFLL